MYVYGHSTYPLTFPTPLLLYYCTVLYCTVSSWPHPIKKPDGLLFHLGKKIIPEKNMGKWSECVFISRIVFLSLSPSLPYWWYGKLAFITPGWKFIPYICMLVVFDCTVWYGKNKNTKELISVTNIYFNSH